MNSCVLILDALMQVVILDIRYPTVPITQLARHNGCVNALAWAPHSASHICTAGDDCQVSFCRKQFARMVFVLQAYP
jgi:hypothetical protein